MKAILVLCALTASLAFPITGQETTEIVGKVIGISDGDTITILTQDKSSVKIRLEGIDAPETSQAFGSKAKDALKALVGGKTIAVEKSGEDRYGRTLGFVVVDGIDVNAKLLEDGWAWHYKKYNSDEQLASLEVRAREKRVGLWADKEPLPPWEFRARQKPQTVISDVAEDGEKSYWLNTSSNVRHNKTCENFGRTKKGRYCGPDEGKPCGKCNG